VIEILRKRHVLEALTEEIVNGSAAAALQRPSRRVGKPSSQDAIASAPVRVLDIRQVLLTSPNSPRVSVLISDDEGGLLAMGLIGNRLGLSSYGTQAGHSLDEQVVELVESEVYGRGRRKWFECPGLPGKPCGTRRMKLYLPPGESIFTCSGCHDIVVPHTPDRPLRRRGELLRQLVLHWRSPLELASRSA